MTQKMELLVHFIVSLVLLLKTGNMKAVMAETMAMKTPAAMAIGEELHEEVVSIDHYPWKKHCRGLYQFPVAA